MSYTQITAENAVAITGMLQTGDINGPVLLSGSAQRLGASQPVFWQTGQRATPSQITLTKTLTTAALAESDKLALEFCQGRKIILLDKDGKTWGNMFCQSSVAKKRKGAAGVYLLECTMTVEALPDQTLVS